MMMMMMMMMNFFENCSVKRYFKSRPLSEIFTTANLRMYLAEFEPKQILSSETEIKLCSCDHRIKFLEKIEKFFIIYKE